MFEIILTTVLWGCAIGCSLMAGVYFAFSGFIMTSFARVETAAGILAMQSINDVILRSTFMPLFFATSVGAVVVIAMAFSDLSRPGAFLMLCTGTLYVTGMFLVTMFFNVPLNNKLKEVEPHSALGAETWDEYLRRWTQWNHVRTVASLVSTILFFNAI